MVTNKYKVLNAKNESVELSDDEAKKILSRQAKEDPNHVSRMSHMHHLRYYLRYLTLDEL